MERFTEISLAEMLDLINKKEDASIYFKNGDEVKSIRKYNFLLGDLHQEKWFRREVIKS